MKKSQELKKAAAESASAAAEYGQHALKEGLERAQDLLDEARHQAGPLLHDAKVRSADFASRRLDDLEPHLKDALDKVNPAVEAARELLEDDPPPEPTRFRNSVVSSMIVRSAANEKSKMRSKPTARMRPATNGDASSGDLPYLAAITLRGAGATKPTTTLVGSLMATKTPGRSRT